MKRILFIALVILLAVTAVRAGEVRGVWTATRNDDGRLQLSISRGNRTHDSHPWQLRDLQGLTEAQIGSATQVPVAFRVAREAGTMAFDGVFKMREGAGHLVFTPNPAYLDTLRNLGVAMDLRHPDRVDENLFELANFDVSTNFIRAMQAEGYREGVKTYVEMRIFNVTPELVREYRAAGYKDIPAKRLVEMQIHGATPQFVRELASAGYRDVPINRLVEFRIHGVTTQFVRELHDLGYDQLPERRLVEMRIHGVTPEYIRELAAAGYRNVPVDKLVAMRIHGVDADYARRMNKQ